MSNLTEFPFSRGCYNAKLSGATEIARAGWDCFRMSIPAVPAALETPLNGSYVTTTNPSPLSRCPGHAPQGLDREIAELDAFHPNTLGRPCRRLPLSSVCLGRGRR